MRRYIATIEKLWKRGEEMKEYTRPSSIEPDKMAWRYGWPTCTLIWYKYCGWWKKL